MSDSLAGAELIVDLNAITANWRRMREQAPGAACGAVVKADAYGLGATRVAPALEEAGCRHIFVAHAAEALALRPVLAPATELFVLHGPPPGSEPLLAAQGITPVLNSLGQLDAWTAQARHMGRALPAVLQVDTGMARLGLSEAELRVVANDPHRLNGVVLRAVMSHLACADDPAHGLNALQLRRFLAARACLPKTPATLAASSGVFLGPEYHFDLVRPGAALYGIAPQPAQPDPMRPVVTLLGRVIQTRTVATGESVGYDAAWHAATPSRIATVSVGYADGLLRSLGNRAVGYVGDIPVPLVGMVSMDLATFDVSAVPEALLHRGSVVELIGPHMPIADVAERAGTISYEILTALGPRYARRYLPAQSRAATTPAISRREFA